MNSADNRRRSGREFSLLHKLTIDHPDRAEAYALGAAMDNLLDPAPEALTVFENGPGLWRIESYFESADAATDAMRELSALLAAPLPVYALEDVPALNWVAMSQEALPPVLAGRFTIHGSHDTHRVPRSPNSLLIDAGEAFGTAHHATTYGCLQAIDRVGRGVHPTTVLDLGCGSGVLAIAVAKSMPHAAIIATDLDRQSTVVARDNIRINGVSSRIRIAVAAGLDHAWLRQSPAFDMIIANILAGPLIMLAPQIARKVRIGGTVILSGLLIDQAPEVLAAYRSVGLTLLNHDRIAGWSTLTLQRRPGF